MSKLALLAGHRAERQSLIGRMAADLIRFEATSGERKANRTMMGCNLYRYGDIAAFAGEALVEAQRRLVASAISTDSVTSHRHISPAARSAT